MLEKSLPKNHDHRVKIWLSSFRLCLLVLALALVLTLGGCADKSVEDERGIAELIPSVPEDVFPAWSPKGDLIAYEHDNNGWGDTDTSGVYLVRCDGSGKLLVAPWGIQPAWHPSGEVLAFAYYGSIWSYDLESRAFTLLVDPPDAEFPAYSPDGRLLSFTRGDALCTYDLFTGSTTSLEDSTNSTILGYHAIWNSIDGRLVFNRRHSYTDIWTCDSEGKKLHSMIAEGYFPRWSPDGQKICYNGPNSGTSIYDLTTSSSVYLVKLFHPCFSPTGDKVVGTRLVGSLDDPYHARNRIFVYDLQTQELTQITH